MATIEGCKGDLPSAVSFASKFPFLSKWDNAVYVVPKSKPTFDKTYLH
jgi:hypothetical protein